METTSLELIIAAVSITATILAAVLATFGFLHREMRVGFKRQDNELREGFKRQDKRMDGQDAEIKELRTDVTGVKVSVARIEGHLGIGFPEPQEQRASDGPPERAA